MSDHKKSLNKGNKVEIMSNVFSDHSGRNYKSKTETVLQNTQKMWNVNNMLLKKKKKTMDLLRNQRGNKKKKPGDKLQTKT